MQRSEDTPGNSVDICQCLLQRMRGSDWCPYTAEEMTYKYHQDPARSILVVGIQTLECMLLPVLVHDTDVGYFLEVSFGGRVVVDLDVPFEVGGGVLYRHLVERGGRNFTNGVDP